MRVCFGLFAIVVLFACDNRFEYELPLNKPRMVVNFISVDTEPWTGTLALSWPILEYGSPNGVGVPGGVLKVYEDGSLIGETKVGAATPGYDQQMTLSSRPTPGKTYTIEASSPDYGTASSTYVQPLPVPIEKFEVELVGPDPEFQNEETIEFRVTFIDPPGENFYEVQAIFAWDSLSLHGQGYQIFFSDPLYENRHKGKFYTMPYFDDTYFEGQRVTMAFRARASESQFLNERPEDRLDYQWITLRNVSKSYYRYAITIDLQQAVWGDPYAQPVKVETNVKGGFGVVGGWTQTAKGKPFIY